MKSQLIYFAVWVTIAVTGSSCIQPPGNIQPSLIPSAEMSTISDLAHGMDLAASGRLESSEYFLWQAFRRAPKRSELASNLGFTLSAEGRFQEAIKFYRLALQLDPKNVVASDGLARTLYRAGELEQSLAEFQRLLAIATTARLDAGRELKAAQIFSNERKVEVLRNMAIISQILGEYDDAVCYSKEAVVLGGDINWHIRQLLALDRAPQAIAELKTRGLAALGPNTLGPAVDSNPVLATDLALALFATGDSRNASVAIAKVLGSLQSGSRERYVARLLKLQIGIGEKDSETVELTARDLIDENPGLCDGEPLSIPSYFPIVVSQGVIKSSGQLHEFCQQT